jgi:hypothetical protein
MKIELDDYQAVNLLSALRTSGCQSGYMLAEKLPEPNPLKVLNSGDWIGEVIYILEQELKLKPAQSVNDFHSDRFGNMHPNFNPTQYVERSWQEFRYSLEEVTRKRKLKEN